MSSNKGRNTSFSAYHALVQEDSFDAPLHLRTSLKPEWYRRFLTFWAVIQAPTLPIKHLLPYLGIAKQSFQFLLYFEASASYNPQNSPISKIWRIIPVSFRFILVLSSLRLLVQCEHRRPTSSHELKLIEKTNATRYTHHAKAGPLEFHTKYSKIPKRKMLHPKGAAFLMTMVNLFSN